MPFTALVQQQFARRALARVQDSTRSCSTSANTLNRKRRCHNEIVAPSTPPWIKYLDNFRQRSFCSSAIQQQPLSNPKMRLFATSLALPLFKLATLPIASSTVIQARNCSTNNKYLADLEQLVQGNKAYRENTSPSFFEESAKGQSPPFMLVDCSDSRVAEQEILGAQPGTLFTSGSIANQFHEWDLNSNSVLSYAVESLAVRHVVVMGHYGCGGVAASMLPVSLPLEHPAHIAVQTWIQPIREIYETSTRPEIVLDRERVKREPRTEVPDIHEPAFRALVEENVKASVNRIAQSYIMRDHYASLTSSNVTDPNDPTSLKGTHVFIHGWVYDLENGEVTDLNVTIGPPGREIPPSPWPSTSVREEEKRMKRMTGGKTKN